MIWARHNLSFKARTASRGVAALVLATVVWLATGVDAQSPVPDDFGNDIANAHPITVDDEGNASQAGVIDWPKDGDFFSFVAPFSGDLTVSQNADESSLNSHLSAFKSDGTRIARNNDSGGSLNAQLNLPVTAGQTYYLKAASAADTVGAYRVDISRGQPLGKKPNIVLIMTDDQSFESLSKMPYLSSRTDWYKFDNAFINNSTCCPSRATFLTGQWSHHHGVEATGGSPKFDDRSTLPTWLDKAGYRTGLFGKYHLGNVNETKEDKYIPPGWDEWYGWHGINGREAYYDYTLNENGNLVSYGSAPQDYSTDVLANKAVDFIKRADENPFFLYFVPRGPHNPWTPAPRHAGAYANEPIHHAPNFNEADMSDKPAWWQTLPLRKEKSADAARRKQYETLLSVDEATRRIVRTLNEKKLMKDTVIVFMTDNGYTFGEHRHNQKLCAYDECNHSPMLMWYPKGKAKTIPQLVSNVDIAPTFAALAGVTPDTPVDGRNILPLVTGPAPEDWPDAVLLRAYHGVDGPGDVPTFWGIRTSKYKYIETVRTGEFELYDLSVDPFELQNVVDRPEYAEIRTQLAERLDEMRGPVEE